MQIINGTTEFFAADMKINSCAVAIGKFDGIHIGHRKILDEVLRAKMEGMCATVFTFEPSPEEFFLSAKQHVLDTIIEKRKKFEEMGIDLLIEFPLTETTARMSPKDFMEEILVKKLRVGLVVSGTDLSFGYKGEGNASMLQSFATQNGFSYKMIDKVCVDKEEVSSTRIRKAISIGEMETANNMLGGAYRISGVVVHGRNLGHTLMMPTVNILPAENKLLPPNGVYVSLSECMGKQYYGITNIGYKPTVSDEKILGIETYLFDFEGNLYGQSITIQLLHFMRPEQKFSDVNVLKRQLIKDKELGMEYLKKNNMHL